MRRRSPGVAADGLGVPPDVVVQQLGHQVDGLDEQVQEGVEAAAVRDLEVALRVFNKMQLRQTAQCRTCKA